jgi:hypothetical protein
MKKLAYILVIIFFAGCVTIKDYTAGNNTLVVGELVYIRNDPKSKEVNGTYKNGISVIIKRIDDDKKIKISTQNNGFFVFQNLQEGVYELIETEFMREIGNTRWHLGGKINLYFTVTKNKVNNLGVIIQNIEERNYTVKSNDYGTVRNDFLDKFSKLQWNNVEWIDVFITYNLPGFSNEQYNPDNENWNIKLLDTAREVNFLTKIEKDIILELNKVRSDPQKYAELYIKPMLQYFDGYMYLEPGKKEKTTSEGIISTEECYIALSGMQGIPILIPEEGLSLGAEDHVKDQGPVGITGHTGTDRSNPAVRVMRYGTGNYIGENISYGPNRADEIVIGLLIDDGVPDRGHRRSIMNKEFTQAGIATGTHKRYGTMCVIEYANNYKSY